MKTSAKASQKIFYVVLLFVPALFLLFATGCKTGPDEKYATVHPTLSLAEFQNYVTGGRVPILDARDVQSYRAGHVRGALNLLSGDDFFANYQKLKKTLARYKNSLVIVYCSDQWCSRADDLQMQLIAQGFQHVARFPGGWAGWQQAGLPAEK